MYHGFNLEIKNDFFTKHLQTGKNLYEENKKAVKVTLAEFENSRGDLVASKVVAQWFPKIDAQVFLSHSHRDKSQVLALAGWLKTELGLTVFVDSSVWGFAGDLMKLIDDAHSKNPEGQYVYERLNRSAAHVHMMLSTALTTMIDHCECVMFLNTPRSIQAKESIQGSSNTTPSPWIYSEIAMTSMIRCRVPDRHQTVVKSFALDSATESLSVQYDVNLGHLTRLDDNDLKNWSAQPTKRGTAALDALYALKRR